MKANLLISGNRKRSPESLKRLQGLPLQQKIALSLRRIKQYYETLDGKVYVAFSGGKDSTVLLHLVRTLYPEVQGVFCDTGLEYPEIRDFVKGIDNVEWVKPKIPFNSVIKKYGYPVISKEVSQKVSEARNTKSEKLLQTRLHGDAKGNGKLSEKWKYLIDAPFEVSGKCCDVMKKRPSKLYERKTGRSPFVGTLAEESSLRRTTWFKKGCNSFNSTRNMSLPLSFWKEEDIWEYLKLYNLPYSKIYEMGEERTGCMFCLFGCSSKDSNTKEKFNRMKKFHPKQYKVCENLGVIEVLDYVRSKE